MDKLLLVLFKEKHTIIIALSLFAFSHFLHWYSNEIKQYMCDVLSVVSIYYLMLKPYKVERNRYILLGATGSVIIFLSNAAPIILLAAGIYILFIQYNTIQYNTEPYYSAYFNKCGVVSLFCLLLFPVCQKSSNSGIYAFLLE
jgi:uncharacterized membrane protein